MTFRGYTRSTPEPSALSLRVTVFLRDFSEIASVGGRHPERGNLFPSRTGITSEDKVFTSDFLRDPSTSTAKAVFAQDDQLGELMLDKC